jgi:hypothetical protein
MHALVRTTNQLLDRTSAADAAAARHEVHTLPAPVTAASSPFDFRCSRQLMQDGYVAARSWLDGGQRDAVVRPLPVRRRVSELSAA